MPTTNEACVISANVTDIQGVQSVELLYQVVHPGEYIQAFLAKSTADLRSRPNDPPEPNPAFDAPENWQSLPRLDDGAGDDAAAGDDVYTATLPAQSLNRTLLRYRILARDLEGASARALSRRSPFQFRLFRLRRRPRLHGLACHRASRRRSLHLSEGGTTTTDCTKP